jgi:hypothetical protein
MAVPFLQAIITNRTLMGAHNNRTRTEALLASFYPILKKPVGGLSAGVSGVAGTTATTVAVTAYVGKMPGEPTTGQVESGEGYIL